MSLRTSSRVVVVGGGILGTMHAVFAVRSGATVIHLDRDEHTRGGLGPQLRARLGERTVTRG